jgi:elongator complex protein 5
MSPLTSVLATYHTDIPTPARTSDSYSPHPLTLLKYLATTIFTTHSLHHILAQKAARDRAEPEPLFGLSGEDVEGVLQGQGSNDPRGIVVELEYRRKSGRGVGEWFYLPSLSTNSASTSAATTSPPPSRKTATLPGRDPSGIILLEDHPLYARPVEEVTNEEVESTFDLGLTEKQRRDREGVVLPYFDAQSGEGGEGGRILYEMGVEDDFDEEEDEI